MSSDAAPVPETLPVPHDLKPLLAKHQAIDWASVAWDAVRARAAQVERAEALARRSRLRADGARALGEMLRRGPA